MFPLHSLNQVKSDENADFLSAVLPVSADIEYKSEDEKSSVNDSGIPKTEEVVFNSFFFFIDNPLKEDIKPKDENEDKAKVRGKKRKKKLSDQTREEYFEKDTKPKDEDDTKEKKRKADKLFNCSDCDFSTNYPTHLRQHEII